MWQKVRSLKIFWFFKTKPDYSLKYFFNSSNFQRTEYQFIEYKPLSKGLTEEEIQATHAAAPLLAIFKKLKQSALYILRREMAPCWEKQSCFITVMCELSLKKLRSGHADGGRRTAQMKRKDEQRHSERKRVRARAGSQLKSRVTARTGRPHLEADGRRLYMPSRSSRSFH